MKNRVGPMLLTLILFTACRNAPTPPPAAARFTEKQLAAEFPADLGPDQIDVSAYPAAQQAHYAFLSEKCSRCHTLARVVNSPLRTEEDWRRYVSRMYGKAEDRFHEKLLSEDEARRIIGFLGYDSRERKQKRGEEFAKQQQQLQDLFREVQAERARVQERRDREKARESAPYMGDKPS